MATYSIYIIISCTHVACTCTHTRALSDFDGVFLPDFGTQHPPANYLSDNSCEIPIASKSSAKVSAESAATFEPMYV